MSSPTTSRSVSEGSGKSRGCHGRRWPGRIETYPLTIRRWRDDGVRPTQRHQLALLALAESMGLGHIFTEWHVPRRAPAPRRVLRPKPPTRRKALDRQGARR